MKRRHPILTILLVLLCLAVLAFAATGAIIMHSATATRCNEIGHGTMVNNAICLQHGSTSVAGVSGVLQCQAIAVCRSLEC